MKCLQGIDSDDETRDELVDGDDEAVESNIEVDDDLVRDWNDGEVEQLDDVLHFVLFKAKNERIKQCVR